MLTDILRTQSFPLTLSCQPHPLCTQLSSFRPRLVVYIQAGAMVKPQLPALPLFAKPPFCLPEFDAWAQTLRQHVDRRIAERAPVDVADLKSQLAVALAQNSELKRQLVVLAPPPPVETSRPALPELSAGKTVADVLADYERLGSLRNVSIRGLNELQPGLGQRVSRTRKLVSTLRRGFGRNARACACASSTG